MSRDIMKRFGIVDSETGLRIHPAEYATQYGMASGVGALCYNCAEPDHFGGVRCAQLLPDEWEQLRQHFATLHDSLDFKAERANLAKMVAWCALMVGRTSSRLPWLALQV